MSKLEKFRSSVLKICNLNFIEVTSSAQFTDKENAGTALLIANAAIGTTAATLAKADPEMAKLSPNGQILKTLELLHDIHSRPKKTHLTVVEGGDA